MKQLYEIWAIVPKPERPSHIPKYAIYDEQSKTLSYPMVEVISVISGWYRHDVRNTDKEFLQLNASKLDEWYGDTKHEVRVVQQEPDYIRAGGDQTCSECHKKYYDHPKDQQYPYLTRLCNGAKVKL